MISDDLPTLFYSVDSGFMHVHILKGTNITVGWISQVVHGFLMQKGSNFEQLDLSICSFGISSIAFMLRKSFLLQRSVQYSLLSSSSLLKAPFSTVNSLIPRVYLTVLQ